MLELDGEHRPARKTFEDFEGKKGQEKAPGRLSLFRLRGLQLTPHTPLDNNFLTHLPHEHCDS